MEIRFFLCNIYIDLHTYITCTTGILACCCRTGLWIVPSLVPLRQRRLCIILGLSRVASMATPYLQIFKQLYIPLFVFVCESRSEVVALRTAPYAV
jgi:hypothetical protein